MKPELVALALRKQRLQMKAEIQREELLGGLAVVESVLDRVDRLRDGIAWLRQNAPVVSTLVLLLLVVRPRFTLRWLRRGVVAWQFFRRVKRDLKVAVAGL